MRRNVVERILGPIFGLFVAMLAPIFALAARSGFGIDACRRWGFQPVRLHFYQPIPRYESMPAATFDAPQPYPGLEFDGRRFVQTLDQLAPFAVEADFPRDAQPLGRYSARNDQFGFSSAALLHAFIRAAGSRRIVEVGGGYSTLVSLSALARNAASGGYDFACVEPYPSAWLRRALADCAPSARLIEAAAETLPVDLFLELQSGDILFVDSSHCVRLGGDVNYLMLQILPKLNPGVLVHVHDIYLPYEYPRAHYFGRRKLYWTEQYLLAALLSGGRNWEILLPAFYVQRHMAAEFARTFPHFDAAVDRPSSSFWMRRRDPAATVDPSSNSRDSHGP